ncbi:lytic transglycosylase domain-containing protein [Sphingomonas canadensis]|uniref:Lytic transglycosylase domain-containing protein n=1 Tax=Sphingomonas canadensis TaxID=1219257 RepID=A0ABW3H4J3_9SPHN|nr:lytic transglycosylase domain-containing protein [Sphingomonas canadensis]MCW3834835.1 lytic transglycosylase domain-containing protein [Sphingomonas canadensis]
MGVNSVANTASVRTAIAAASRKTGIDFNYLLGQAQSESGLQPTIRAQGSTATGLYQFIEQSWLGVVKRHGAEHGLGWAADSIRQNSSGRYVVSDPGVRRAILDLRTDPAAAAMMAAEHASDNKDALQASLGRDIGAGDLYMAHFLGLGGARTFLSAMDRNPDRAAAGLFPAAAAANRSIFYNSKGQPRTLQQVYDMMSRKIDRGAVAAGGTAPSTAVASSGVETFALPEAAAPKVEPLPPEWLQLLGGDGEIVLGNGATQQSDGAWIHTTLANLGTLREPVNPLRPTPETAKLAYLMLASLGA